MHSRLLVFFLFLLVVAPKDTSIVPDTDSISVGQSVTCRTRANPSIRRYVWELNNEEVASSESMRVPSRVEGQNIALRCTVVNANGNATVMAAYRVAGMFCVCLHIVLPWELGVSANALVFSALVYIFS